MAKTILRAPAAIACSFALAASLAVPTALASSGAYGDDVDDIVYVDEDEDGYDDNTDEWIGFGTADAASANSESGAASSSVSTAAVPGAAAGAATGVTNASAADARTGGASGASGTEAASSGSASGSSSASSTSETTASGNGPAASSAESGDKDGDGSAAASSGTGKEDGKDGSSKDKDKPTSSAFTFAGTGTTVDNATSGDGVEFFTIKTDDDKVYYLVVDRNSGTDNVYLLNTVTGGDLEALAESGKINLGKPAAVQPAEEKKEEEPKQEEPERQGVPEWLAYLLVVAVVGGGAFAYYQLKVKPEREESKVDEREVRSFEADGIYPTAEPGRQDAWNR